MKDPTKRSSAPLLPKEKEGLLKMNLDPIIKNLRVKTNKDLISQIRSSRNNNQFISLVLMDGVQLLPEMILPLFEVLQKIGKTKHLDVFLYTTGGATEVPWRIVSLIREFCDEFTAIIPFIALSAGTHIALGADQLLMSEISTLGPVDPTTRHALLPRDKNDQPIPVSVEDLKNCIKFISQQLKDQDEELKYTPTDMTNIVSKLFEHIEPLAIGAVERAYGLSRLVTRKVLETHLDASKDKDKIDTIVNKIGGEYFSHSFPITRRDVEQELKLKVEKPSADLFDKIWALYEYYRGAFSVQQDLQLNFEQKDQKGVTIGTSTIPILIRILGFLDSETERRALLQLRTIKKEGDDIKEESIFVRWLKPSETELPVDSPNYFLAIPEQPVPQQPPSL
ncbi:MAG: hypothetical protein QMD03_03610 [Syntrophales bacterium]|nr:hypothetical protein [Syntrophales bacterium]